MLRASHILIKVGEICQHFCLIAFAMYSRLHSSYDVARRTVLLMREICSKTRWANAVYVSVLVTVESGMLTFVVSYNYDKGSSSVILMRVMYTQIHISIV